MKEIEFDLLTEPWIRVRLKDNTVQEVSLTEALVSAQDYVDLAGEMPTQDAAVLRLLLAVLFTVFSRVNVKGEPEPLEKRGQALFTVRMSRLKSSRLHRVWAGSVMEGKPTMA